jgi:NitT/TauT family transport system ATP-binding protein
VEMISVNNDKRITRNPVRSDNVLAVRGLSKRYPARTGARLVLDRIDLEVSRGQFLCIVGPSGAGKTTLLRCMSGLLEPTDGTVLLDGEPIVDPPPTLAVVFQDYSRSLMPWLSIERNVMLPLRSQGLPGLERRNRVRAALDAVGLSDVRNHYPWQLSGGMQQRAAIARALAYRPEALLMDEPFASVDAQTRSDLEDLVLGLKDKFGVTVILVTHDIEEAVYLGDQVVVLSGSPARVRECIPINLGPGRDQLTTKSLPEFGRLRGRVLRLIRTNESDREV